MRLLFEIIRYLFMAGFGAVGVWSGWHMALTLAARNYHAGLRFWGFAAIGTASIALTALTASIP